MKHKVQALVSTVILAVGAVQRLLTNGNTLVSEDTQGRIFQVRPDENHVDGGEIVWEYVAFNTDEKKFNSWHVLNSIRMITVAVSQRYHVLS